MSKKARLLQGPVRRDLEPEDCIANALYLLQLCQQDLNIGRKETVWPRARAAKDLCAKLEEMFQPNAKLRDAAPALPRPQPASEGKDLTP